MPPEAVVTAHKELWHLQATFIDFTSILQYFCPLSKPYLVQYLHKSYTLLGVTLCTIAHLALRWAPQTWQWFGGPEEKHRKHYRHIDYLVIRGEKGRRREEGGGGDKERKRGEKGGGERLRRRGWRKKVGERRNNAEIRNRREEAVPTFSSFCLLLARPRFFFRSAFSACSASIIALGVCGVGRGKGGWRRVGRSREGGVRGCNLSTKFNRSPNLNQSFKSPSNRERLTVVFWWCYELGRH